MGDFCDFGPRPYCVVVTAINRVSVCDQIAWNERLRLVWLKFIKFCESSADLF